MWEQSSQLSDVLCEVFGRVGVITLNRPKALNALSLEMVLEMRAFLTHVGGDPNIQGVVIRSALPDVFCAGGDIKAAYALYQLKDYEGMSRYIREEYALNQQIADFQKPVVALIDGLALGGGVGISRYAKYRVITERAKIGMPEIKIAFFPDVGAGYFLNKLDLALSRFLAITGHVLSGQDLMDTGYATHVVASENMTALCELLVEGGVSEVALQRLCVAPKSGVLDGLNNVVSCFSKATLSECLELLEHVDTALYRTLKGYSPLALQIIWKYMEVTRSLSYADVVNVDLTLAHHMFERSDFFEGIRTRLIDKGDQARWQHKDIADITPKQLDTYFQ